MNFGNDEEILSLTQRFAKHARDFDDLQHEIAGRDVGRMGRFLPGGAQSAASSGKSNDKRAEALTRLQAVLMNNPAYAQAFQETERALNDAQSQLDTLLERVQREIEANDLVLADIRERAARLEDGSRVYKDQDGRIRSENGDQINDALAAGILWRGDEPSFEDMKDARERGERLKDIERDIQIGQGRIGEMQADMKDEDDPPTRDELELFQDEADKILGDLESDLNALLEPRISDESKPSLETSPASISEFLPR